MNNMFKKRTRTILLSLVVLAGVIALIFSMRTRAQQEGGDFAITSSDETVLVLADSGWDSQRLHNEIVRLIIENAYDGYVIKTSTASTPMNWQALLAGDVDLDLECWPDNIVTYEEDLKNGYAVELGINTPDSKQGFYVPRYVIEGDAERGIKAMAPDLKTVKDLAKYPEIFPDDEDKTMGRVYGAIPGWFADEILHKKYEFYGLDEMYNYVRLGSDSTLFASLVSAYNLGDAWVGYCFEPTVVSGKLDIVLLEDEPYDKERFHLGATEFKPQALKVLSNRHFAKKAPDLVPFLKKYGTNSKIVAEALAYIDDEKATHAETAKWILKTHPNLLKEWLPKKRADKIRAIL